MKKFYETPKSTLIIMDTADVITASGTLRFNTTENALIDSNDVHNFDGFFDS